MAYVCYLVYRLPSSTIRGKTSLKVWSEKVLRVFGCPAYYHVKEDKLDPIAKKGMFVRFKKRVKSYKIWDPKDKKFVLSRDITFDEPSILKPIISQRVEIEKTKGIWQQVKSDDTSPFLEISVSLEIIPTVTQDSDHVTDQDTDDDED